MCIPGLPLSRLARKAYLRLTGVPRFSWDTIRRIAGSRRRAATPGSTSTACSARPSCASSAGRCGSSSAIICPTTTCELNLERARRWHPLNRSLYLGARVMLPGLLLASKGDRVAMNSSVETRYPFLDEEVFASWPGCIRAGRCAACATSTCCGCWPTAGCPKSIAWRRKAMFRAPLDGFHHGRAADLRRSAAEPGIAGEDGLFRRRRRCSIGGRRFKQMRQRSNQRTMIEMGLVGVVATQLWHHTFIDGSLADLPTIARLACGEPSPGDGRIHVG